MTLRIRYQHWTQLAGGAACLLALFAGSCTTQQVTTPTRTLDRPSDVALFCVDYEIPDCLPKGNAEADPEGYLNEYCSGDAWRSVTPRATVLALDECDDNHRRLRRDSYLSAVRKAAVALGRDPDVPCCPGDNTSCGTAPPTCSRRVLSTLIANTARGELAVADTQAQTPGLTTIGRLHNLHGGQLGYGFLPTGLLPEHVRAFSPPQQRSPNGAVISPDAWAVTTNVGSCDLSVVSLQPVANLTTRAAICDDADQSCPTQGCDALSCPKQVQPFLPGAAGSNIPLLARPSWVETAPWLDGPKRTAVVAYPTCGLVAVVDLQDGPSQGQVIEGIGFDPSDATKPARILTAGDLAMLKCPADCGGDASPLMPDINRIPALGTMRAATYPATLATDKDGQRLLIGDAVGSALTVVNIDPAAADGAHFIGTPRRITLDFVASNEVLRAGRPGIDRIRVSPRSAAGLYAYVVARDSSVRVVDLDREVECETNPDPRFLMQNAGGSLRVLPDEWNDSNLRRLGCLPVGPGTPRSPLYSSPGLTLPNGSLPRDVGFVHQDTPPCAKPGTSECPFTPDAVQTSWLQATAGLWIGDFAWLLGGGGIVAGIQMADACPQPSYRACFPEFGALRRLSLLHTRSQELPAPEQLNLPGLSQALSLTPQDRLGNVRRAYSRFDDGTSVGPGPRTETDSTGLPVYSPRVGSSVVSVFANLGITGSTQTRRRLLLPAPTPYYYLPVDPICDMTIREQAVNLSKPDASLPAEPTRRPVALASFTDPLAVTTEQWTLDWEGTLAGLSRNTGRLLSTGQLADLNGLYCNRGAEKNDKLWFGGCYANSDCPTGTLCRREQVQTNGPGICLSNAAADQCRALSQRLMVDTSNDTEWAVTWLRRYRISKAEQQVPLVTGGDVADRLTLSEITEPEFSLEQQSCDMQAVGTACPGIITVRRRNAPLSEALIEKKTTCRVTGKTSAGAPEKSCILECTSNQDCGDGFYCGRSALETLEMPARAVGRCLRAPLITPDAITRDGTPLGADATALLAACFPDQQRYEIHGGDAFVVRGDRTGAPTLSTRASDGTCQRPQPGDPSYQSSRLLQPRLHLGPRDSLADGAPGRCPNTTKSWISHRVPGSVESTQSASCQKLLTAQSGVVLPSGNVDNPLFVLPGRNFWPQEPDRVRELVGPTRGASRRIDQWNSTCAANPADPSCADPWLNREFELFSMLPIAGAENQCVLTDATEELYPTESAATSCTGFCLFPGDHSERGGVRRIHFENAYGNLVLRVPRDPSHPTLWAVPPEGYSVSFAILGGQQAYVQAAQTSQRDASSGLLAQSLKAAVTALDGVVYLIDEGRTGSVSGLRGQVLRLIGAGIDPYFLLR